MTLTYLLDTNVASEPMRKRPQRTVIGKIEEHAHEAAIGSPVWHEMNYGLLRLPAGRRRAELSVYVREIVRSVFEIIPYDDHAAAWHAEQRARLEGQGRPVPHFDGQIAAIAATNGLILVTRNVSDFDVFDDLAIENWEP